MKRLSMLTAAIGLLGLGGFAWAQEKDVSKDVNGQDGQIELIIRTDDLGFCHSANMAFKRIFETGVCTAASVMVNTPWIDEAVAILRDHPEISVGVHLTLNSEWREYRWGPVLGRDEVGSLVDEFGRFFGTRDGLMANRPVVEEVARELRAQIEMGLKRGLKISYLDHHMGSAAGTREFQQILEKLAAEYKVGISRYFGEDYLKSVYFVAPGEKLDFAIEVIKGLDKPGLYLMVIHPGLDTPELSAMTDYNKVAPADMAKHRQAETGLLCDPKFKKAIGDKGIKLVSYADLKSRGLERMKRPFEAEPYEKVVAEAIKAKK